MHWLVKHNILIYTFFINFDLYVMKIFNVKFLVFRNMSIKPLSADGSSSFADIERHIYDS